MAISFTPITFKNAVDGGASMDVNFVRAQAAFADALSRTNSSNNEMRVDLDMNSKEILNVKTDPSNPQSLLNVGEADTRFVQAAGDSMSGDLDMSGNTVNGLRTPASPNEAATKGYVDTRDDDQVSRTGDSMSGDLDMQKNDIWDIRTTETKNLVLGGLPVSPGELNPNQVIWIDTIADLSSLDTTKLADGHIIEAKGTTLYWSSTSSKFIPISPISVTSFGATGDGTSDDSSAFIDMSNYLKGLATLEDSRQKFIPEARIPAGKYRITQKKALSAAFTSGHTRGLSFVGDGEEQTELLYDSSLADSDNYLGDFSYCSYINFSGITFNFSNSVLKGIFWSSTGDGTGSFLSFRNCRILGNYDKFLDIGGTVLGSETYFERVSGPVPSGGVFFNVQGTNPQAVNHTFVNCTIGGGGTVFRLLAGGNIRWYGGYVSMFENHKFLDINASGTQIGSNNKNILIDGCNFETNSSPVGPRTLLINSSPASIKFSNCNFNAISGSITGTNTVITMGDASSQKGGDLIFDNCIAPDRKTEINGGVYVKYVNCDGMSDWQSFMTLTRSTTSNLLQPVVEIDGCKPEGSLPYNPVDCSPGVLVNSYGSASVPSIQQTGIKTKLWIARNGDVNTSNGLVAGLGSTYQYFDLLVPYGSIVTKIKLYYFANSSISESSRTYKVENATGEVLLPESVISFPATGPAHFESSSLFYIADTEDKRELRFYGKVAAGTTGATVGDYGFFEIEYM